MREYMVEEEHGILTYNEWMFSLPPYHFQFKSVNISTILTSELKDVCMCGHLFLAITWNEFIFLELNLV